MKRVSNSPKKKSATSKKSRMDVAHLDELIEDAIVDCYGNEEQLTGIYTMMEEYLGTPFITKVLGMEVTVTEIDLNDADQIVAVCKQGKYSQRVPIIDLPLPAQPPKGAEWIEAYRRWVRLLSVTDYHGIGPKIRAPATVGRRFIRRRVGNRGARAAGDKPPPYSASTQRGFSVREKSRTYRRWAKGR